MALEPFLEEVKLELADIQFKKPKPNITPGELQALKQLSRDKTIILKKADKGKTSVMMNKESKTNEGLALLNEKDNYQPLTQPMVETTTRKVTQLTKSPLQEGHIRDLKIEVWPSYRKSQTEPRFAVSGFTFRRGTWGSTVMRYWAFFHAVFR